MEKLKTYTQEELNEILENHKEWLENNGQGKRANLSRANLYGANLYGADLGRANLSRANLYGANLSRADLHGANLSRANLYGDDLHGANLSRADLSGADLSRANLYGADLHGSNLSRADLSGVDLSRADLSGADLSGADLHGADLYGADLYGADLSGADLSGADLHGADLYEVDLRGVYFIGVDFRGAKNIPFIPMACPDEGEFIGWKKAYIENHQALVKLKILEDSKRSSATGRKCRTDKALVLSIIDLKENKERSEAFSNYDNDFKYTVGEIVSVSDFDDDRFNECAPGIHFFINKEEALNY